MVFVNSFFLLDEILHLFVTYSVQTLDPFLNVAPEKLFNQQKLNV